MMKHLKTTFCDLRELFEVKISVKYIAEPIASFDMEARSSDVRAFMKDQVYDVIGVRRNGLVVGYAKEADLMDGTLADHLVEFLPYDLVDDEAPLIDVFMAIRHSPQLFIQVLN